MEKIFDDKYLNKLDKNIYEIPDDIKRKIYEEYFEPKLKAEKLCDELLKNLNTSNSQNLNTKDILPLIKKILENKLAISYLNEIDSTFSMLYQHIILEKKRNFVLLLPENDMALSWLYMLYH